MSKKKPEKKTNVSQAYAWIADELDMKVTTVGKVIAEWNDYRTALAQDDPIVADELDLKARKNSQKRKRK